MLMKRKNLLLPSLLCALAAFTPAGNLYAQNAAVAAHFEKIRGNEASLQQFFYQMPKGGDLHNHLTGSVYAETYFNIAEKDSMYLDTTSYKLIPGNAALDSASRKRTVRLYPGMSNRHDFLWRCIDQWSVRNFVPAKIVLPPDEFFFAAFGKFGAAGGNYLADFLKELRLRAQAENVQYLEIMATGPWLSNDLLSRYQKENTELMGLINARDSAGIATFFKNLSTVWGKDEKVQGDVKSFVTMIDQLDQNSRDAAPGVTTYYQTYASRNNPNPLLVFAQLYVGFMGCKLNPKLVGVNIVQAENGDYSLRDYWGHMQMFRYLKGTIKDASNRDVNTAMHAGELRIGLTPPEDLQSHIYEAVFTAGANRIGHGVDIAFEKQSPALLKEMANRKIPVEINLSSNDFILGVKNGEHPIMLYFKNNVPVVISTDDPGILRSNLTQEFVTAALRYPQLKYEDFRRFMFNSIEYSFMPAKVKEEQKRKLATSLLVFEKSILENPAVATKEPAAGSGKSGQ